MTAGYQFPDAPFMTASEVAKVVRLSQNHVYHLADMGVIPSVRFGRAVRFPTAVMKQLAEAKTEKPDSAPTEPGLS